MPSDSRADGDARPDAGFEVELQQVLVAHSVVAAVEVDAVVPQHRAVRVAPVRQVRAGAVHLLPRRRGEVKREHVAVPPRQDAVAPFMVFRALYVVGNRF